jgi:hypothetical protein
MDASRGQLLKGSTPQEIYSSRGQLLKKLKLFFFNFFKGSSISSRGQNLKGSTPQGVNSSRDQLLKKLKLFLSLFLLFQLFNFFNFFLQIFNFFNFFSTFFCSHLLVTFMFLFFDRILESEKNNETIELTVFEI